VVDDHKDVETSNVEHSSTGNKEKRKEKREKRKEKREKRVQCPVPPGPTF
jgi:hypothetical protein